MANIINPILINHCWSFLVDSVTNPILNFDGIFVTFNGLKVVFTGEQLYTNEQFEQLDEKKKKELARLPSLEKRLAYIAATNNEFAQTKEYQVQQKEIAQTIFKQWKHEQQTCSLPTHLKAIYFYFLKRLFNFRSISESSYLCWYPINL